MRLETVCVQGTRDKNNTTGALCVPVYQSATFAHGGLGKDTGYSYSRLQNPTREAAENLVAALEGGAGCLGFPTGMAAVTLVMELFDRGDEIIASNDMYGGIIRMFNHVLKKRGVLARYVNTSDLSAVRAAINDNTKAIFIETPTNPMMYVTDIAGVSDIIAGRDILFIVDNTFLTPYYCRPISLGAHIVIHSATKYLSGHNDTMAGFVVASTDELCERLKFLHKTTGAVLAPFDAFLIIRGIKTLAVRMEKSQQSAIKIAEWLKGHPKVSKVYYAGLPEHPEYAISKKQSAGFGAMISFTVTDEQTARGVLGGVKLILFAESLGGCDTLITYPVTQTHADVPEEERAARGINETLLRISVGLENTDDLIEDLRGALA